LCSAQCLLARPPTPRAPLFPYTTLFRSEEAAVFEVLKPRPHPLRGVLRVRDDCTAQRDVAARIDVEIRHDLADDGEADRTRSTRSEEHTSELQSRVDLVCRLLLEQKKET